VEYGIEHEAIDGAYDVTIFEDLGTVRRSSPSLEMTHGEREK